METITLIVAEISASSTGFYLYVTINVLSGALVRLGRRAAQECRWRWVAGPALAEGPFLAGLVGTAAAAAGSLQPAFLRCRGTTRAAAWSSLGLL